MRISAHTRRRFADFCAGWGTVRSIAQLFEVEGIFPGDDYARRSPASAATRSTPRPA